MEERKIEPAAFTFDPPKTLVLMATPRKACLPMR